MSDIYRRDTGSALKNHLLAERDRIRGKMYPTSVVVKEAKFHDSEEISIPPFPFLPRLEELPFSDLAGPAKIRRIQHVIANHFGITFIDLVSDHRTKKIILPRQISMYFSRILTTRSFPDIGRRFGGRDHTTVHHAVRKIKKRMADDAEFTKEIEMLHEMLN